MLDQQFRTTCEVRMLSKCANPNCTTSFQYLRDGKLFQVEVDGEGHARPSGPRLVSTKTGGVPLHMEHYWLCGPCSGELTLAIDRGKGITTVPLHRARGAAAS